MPAAGQSVSAAAKASANASSAAATSPRARRKEGDQLPIAAARHSLSHLWREVGLARHYMAQIGRTSIAPTLAPGQRAAHERAASRSGTSIR